MGTQIVNASWTVQEMLLDMYIIILNSIIFYHYSQIVLLFITPFLEKGEVTGTLGPPNMHAPVGMYINVNNTFYSRYSYLASDANPACRCSHSQPVCLALQSCPWVNTTITNAMQVIF